jgi:hypothetical protein
VLVEELEDLRLEVLSPLEARKASGIVLFRVPGGLRENFMVTMRLRSRGVMVSARGGPLGSEDKGLCALPQRGGGL